MLEMRSDNGTNFVGANAELKQAFKELDQEQIGRFTSNHGINWCFNAPAASHHGGVWERQIRTVRKILQSLLQTQFLKTCQNEEQLNTFLCEVEATINSRPLTRSSDDPDDLGVITPNDLLLLRPNKVDQPGEFIKTDIYAKKDGVKCSIWQAYFGKDGLKSTFLIYSNVRNGCNHIET